MKIKIKYTIICTDTGIRIETYDSLNKAINKIKQFEKEDIRDNIYTPNYYKIIEEHQ